CLFYSRAKGSKKPALVSAKSRKKTFEAGENLKNSGCSASRITQKIPIPASTVCPRSGYGLSSASGCLSETAPKNRKQKLRHRFRIWITFRLTKLTRRNSLRHSNSPRKTGERPASRGSRNRRL